MLIASPDWSKWVTDHAEENTEEIHEAGISAIAFDCGTGRDRWRKFRMCFMRLFQCKSTESKSLTQTSCTDVFERRVRGFNKQGPCLSYDDGKFVIWSARLRHQPNILLGNNGETQLHLTRPCVEHNAGLRKTSAALCRGKHNAALFCNPNQDVGMAMQGDFECLLNKDGFEHTDIQIQRRSERYGRTPGFKDSNVNNLVTTDQTNITLPPKMISEMRGADLIVFRIN